MTPVLALAIVVALGLFVVALAAFYIHRMSLPAGAAHRRLGGLRGEPGENFRNRAGVAATPGTPAPFSGVSYLPPSAVGGKR